jgi:hypothetical protein
MHYFVIGPDGSKYGPADLSLINTWIAEGRISPLTILETDSGMRLAASTVQGLNFPVPATPPQSFTDPQSRYQSYDGSQSFYYRPGYQHNLFGSSGLEITLSWICAGLSVFSVCACGLFTIILSLAGLVLGILAKRKNQDYALAAIIVNSVLSVIWIILGIGYIAMFTSAMTKLH